MTTPLYRPTNIPWLGIKRSVSVVAVSLKKKGYTADPSAVLGSITIVPSAADAVGYTNGPVVVNNLIISPAAADARGYTTDPTVVIETLIVYVSPTAAYAVGYTANPTVVQGSTSYTPSAADAVGYTAIGTVTVARITPTVHWFWDARTNGWFKDKFASGLYDPISVHVFDGDKPHDRVLMVGGEDGYVRYFDDSAYQDDDSDFAATVTMGPLADPNARSRLILTEVQGVLDINGDSIEYEVLTGDTPEAAFATEDTTFAGDGTFTAGMSVTHNPRVGGYVLYVKAGAAAASKRWAMEHIRTRSIIVASNRGRRRDNDSL